ncbi:MAG: hypothetical protein HGB22_05015 [Chlorobiaceae bacterium]|nr:hypothetical protein [Chlorobiaceae bacterium]
MAGFSNSCKVHRADKLTILSLIEASECFSIAVSIAPGERAFRAHNPESVSMASAFLGELDKATIFAGKAGRVEVKQAVRSLMKSPGQSLLYGQG